MYQSCVDGLEAEICVIFSVGSMGTMDGHLAPVPPGKHLLRATLYPDAEVPWRDDPAFTLLREFPGLQASVSGRIARCPGPDHGIGTCS